MTDTKSLSDCLSEMQSLNDERISAQLQTLGSIVEMSDAFDDLRSDSDILSKFRELPDDTQRSILQMGVDAITNIQVHRCVNMLSEGIASP